jgi:hypothetical protein
MISRSRGGAGRRYDSKSYSRTLFYENKEAGGTMTVDELHTKMETEFEAVRAEINTLRAEMGSEATKTVNSSTRRSKPKGKRPDSISTLSPSSSRNTRKS